MLGATLGASLGAGLLLANRGNAMPVGNPRVPEPARPIDLNPYLGRWGTKSPAMTVGSNVIARA